MKSRFYILMLLTAMLPVMDLFAAPKKVAPAAKPENPKTENSKSKTVKSVFVLPKNPSEGRDPFFPGSMRPYGNIQAAPDVVSASDLTVKGILQSGERIFAIINNHTFAPGEIGTVLSDDGRRIDVHCLTIDPKTETVTVELSGAKAVLHFSPNL